MGYSQNASICQTQVWQEWPIIGCLSCLNNFFHIFNKFDCRSSSWYFLDLFFTPINKIFTLCQPVFQHSLHERIRIFKLWCSFWTRTWRCGGRSQARVNYCWLIKFDSYAEVIDFFHHKKNLNSWIPVRPWSMSWPESKSLCRWR